MGRCIRSINQVQFPADGEGAMTRQDVQWLASLQYWAAALVRGFRVAEADIADVVLRAFARVKIEWPTFQAPEDMGEGTARRRWIAQILFRYAGEHRRAQRARRQAAEGGVA